MLESEIVPIGLFLAFVTFLLILDLRIFNRHAHAVSLREAALMSAFWIGMALAVNVFIFALRGRVAGVEYFTAWLLEKSLSVDNLFVFLVIFSYFAVQGRYQRRVLSWGIIGAIALRGVMILLGASLIEQFHWIIYLFGAFLIYTGLKIARGGDEDEQPDLERNPVVRVSRRFVPMSPDYDEEKFFVRHAGKVLATPLLLVLIVIETTDVAFAVDSIPAVLAVTPDPLIVFSSNIMAILGLRALYFLLAGTLDKFRYLKLALGIILTFVGLKMLAEDAVLKPMLGLDHETLSLFTLIFVVVVLGVAGLASVIYARRHPSAPAQAEFPPSATQLESQTPGPAV